MATASNDMKSFYRQRKNKKTGITKSSSFKSASKSKKSSPKHAAAIGSDITQPVALIFHGAPDLQDGYDKHEQVLRQFDINVAYGPCLGMTRLARWERAKRLGMNSPREIESVEGWKGQLRMPVGWPCLKVMQCIIPSPTHAKMV